MEEVALKYEYIIRKGHNVNRLEIPAAHADSFRALEVSYISYRDNKKLDKKDDLLFKYAFKCGEIVANLTHAIWEFEKRSEPNLTELDKKELDDIELLLIDGKMEEIDQAIELIERLFKRHKIFI